MPQKLLHSFVDVSLGQGENSPEEMVKDKVLSKVSESHSAMLILASSFTSCVSLSKCHKISETQFLKMLL